MLLRKIIIPLSACAIILTASACNTVKGLGRDIESVGAAGEKVVR